jgi:hypothetical protein
MATSAFDTRQREVSIEEAFAALYDDEDFHDVKLQGNDGIQVSANRNALAARSQFFKSMLLGKFSEATNDVVKVGFSGRTLKAVVEYIHTNNCNLLERSIPRGRPLDPSSVERLRAVLSLDEASSYFILPGLAEKVTSFVEYNILAIPDLSFVVLEACYGDPLIQATIRDLAVSTISSNATNLAKSDAVGLLSAMTMEDLHKKRTMELRDDERFDFIQRWMNDPWNVSVTPHEKADRAATAASLVTKYVHLQNIDPQILSTTVESSGLVSLRQLADAYKMQALEAKRASELRVKKPRQIPVWKDSGSDVLNITKYGAPFDAVNVINSGCLSSGSHQWTIAVEETIGVFDSIIVGVIQSWSPFERKSSICGLDQVGNLWDSGYRATLLVEHLEFRSAGARVTVKLNLSRADVNNGSLWISVNGNQPVLAKKNLLCYLGGFVPAAKVAGRAKLRIVDFQEIQPV